MSDEIEFFMARSDRAAARVHAQGPRRKYPTVSGAYFEADDAVLLWEDLLLGRAPSGPATLDRPRMVADYVHDGSGVFRLPDLLVSRLGQADDATLRRVADGWVAEAAKWRDDVPPDSALGIVSSVAAFARESLTTGRPIYCWVSG